MRNPLGGTRGKEGGKAGSAHLGKRWASLGSCTNELHSVSWDISLEDNERRFDKYSSAALNDSLMQHHSNSLKCQVINRKKTLENNDQKGKRTNGAA